MKAIIKFVISLLFSTQPIFSNTTIWNDSLTLLNVTNNCSLEEIKDQYDKIMKNLNKHPMSKDVDATIKRCNAAHEALQEMSKIRDTIAADPCACYQYTTRELTQYFCFFNNAPSDYVLSDQNLASVLCCTLQTLRTTIDRQHNNLLSLNQEDPTFHFFAARMSEDQRRYEKSKKIERIKINIAYELLQRKFNPASLRKSKVGNDIKFNEEPLLKKRQIEYSEKKQIRTEED